MYLGIDLGTSSVKLLLLSQQGAVVESASRELEVTRPYDGWSEQDPATWITGVTGALSDLGKKQDVSSIRAIGLSGQMHGATLIDKDGEVLRPCILWNDTRSFKEADELDAIGAFRETTGNIVFPGFTAPKINWVRRNEPEIFDRVSKVLLPKDYLRFWLTGECVSEMSDAAGTSWLDVEKRDWSDQLLAETALSRDHMPALVEGSAVSGYLRPTLAEKLRLEPNIPIAGGAGDNAASAIGAGIVNKGDAFISLGTSGVLFTASDAYSPDPETALHSFCHALPNRWHQMGVILSAADALSWFAKFSSQTVQDLDGALGQLTAPGRAMFLPYLGGERTPHNDAKIRGAMIGLQHDTNAVSGARAVMEGVAFAFCDSMEAMRATGTNVASATALGGGSNSKYWLEAIATVLNIQIDVPKDGDFGAAYGAARLGQIASGDADETIITKPAIDHAIEPNERLRPAFQDAYQRYKNTYLALKELS